MMTSRIGYILAGAFFLIGQHGLRAVDAAFGGLTVHRMPNGVRFGLIGARPSTPAPTLFVLQGDIVVALREPIYTEVARIMARHGCISVMLDAPAHGEDRRPGDP